MYIGNDLQIAHPSYKIIDDISSGFNGSTTSFALQVSGATPVPFPISTQQVMISVNGVVQEPDPTGSAGFKLLGSNIVFSSAPANGHAFFGVINAGADYVTAGSEFPDGSATAPSFTFQDDQDTGWFRSGSGAVGYSANGVQTLTFDGNGLTVTGDASFVGDSSKNLLWDKSDGQLEFADNAKATFGTGGDLSIYHSSSNSQNTIKSINGRINFNASETRMEGADGSELIGRFIENGAVELYHNGLKTLYTDSLGFSVKGGDTSSKTQLSIWGNEGQRGVLQISADDGDDNADHWQFQARTDGNLNIQNLNSGSWGNSAVFVGGGAAMFYNNNVKALETVNNGIKVSGAESGDALLYLSADEGDDNADQWRVKADTSGNFGIDNYSTGSWVNGLTINSSNNAATFAGQVNVGSELHVDGTYPVIELNDTDSNSDWQIRNANGEFALRDITNNANRFTITSAGTAEFPSSSGTVSISAGTVSDSIGDVRKLGYTSTSSAYTLLQSDNGKFIEMGGGGVTAPSGMAAGTMITIINVAASDQTITQGSNFTLTNSADASTGNRTLASKGMATILFTGSANGFISGAGLS